MSSKVTRRRPGRRSDERGESFVLRPDPLLRTDRRRTGDRSGRGSGAASAVGQGRLGVASGGSAGRFIEAWVTEPLARLYGITREPRHLEFCGLIREHLGTCEVPCHAHGFMSTLRGLQIAAR